MKKTFFSLLFFTGISLTAFAQSIPGFGIKAGLNYNANGDYFESISQTSKNPDRNVGYHIGLFGKIGDQIFFKPEVVYTNTKSDYDDDSFKMQKLDIPLLVGVKIIGPLNVFAGPSFQYILDTKYDNITIDDVDKDLTVGLNFGVGVNFKKVGLDLRYERGFNKNEATFLDNNGVSINNRLDTRPDQLILSLSLLL